MTLLWNIYNVISLRVTLLTSSETLMKADPVQTKHQLFKTKLLLQQGHLME